MADLIVERRGGILLLTINREHVRNAIDAATAAAIDKALTEGDADPAVGAFVLTGIGSRAFCSGMDIKEAARIGAGHGLIPGRGFAGITQGRRNKPLIAAVNGIAVAGGLEIALACDLIFAADHAQFGLSEIKRGLFAFAGGIQRLAQQVPRATAMAIILTGEAVSAQRLHQLGVITEVVPAADLLARSLEVTAGILTYSGEAIRNAKQLFEMAVDAPLDQSLRFGNAFGQATLNSAVSREGVKAYAEHRPADLGGKDDSGKTQP